MFKQIFAVLFVAGLAQAAVQPKDLICDICLDVVTDLDEWLTSDATEGEIVHFMESVSVISNPHLKYCIGFLSAL
jgi:hypothetical protein